MDVEHGAGQPAPGVLMQAARHVVAGRNVMPLSRSRKPIISWKRWQTELQIDLPHPDDDAFLVENFDREDVGLGVITGAISGIVVMDYDDEAAWNAVRDICEMPRTVRCYTGKGRHEWFAHPGGDRRNKTGLHKLKLDVRGNGGFVVAPPTHHPKYDRAYAWADGLSPWDVALAPMPEELIAWCWPPEKPRNLKAVAITAPTPYIKSAVEGEVLNVLTAPKGSRNATLNRAAYSLFRLAGIDYTSASQALLDAARQVGLGEHEAVRTIASAMEARRA